MTVNSADCYSAGCRYGESRVPQKCVIASLFNLMAGEKLKTIENRNKIKSNLFVS